MRKINRDLHGHTRTGNDTEQNTNKHLPSFSSVTVGESPCQSPNSACLAAKAALALLNLACYFLDRQVERLAQDFKITAVLPNGFTGYEQRNRGMINDRSGDMYCQRGK